MQLLQRNASLPGGSWQYTCCNALHHCGGGSAQWNSIMPRNAARVQWAVQLFQCTTSLPRAVGPSTLPHSLGAVGSATPVMYCHTGQWNSCNALPHSLGALGC